MKEVKDSYLFDVLFRFDDFKINEPKTNNIYDTNFIGRVQLLNKWDAMVKEFLGNWQN